MEIEELKQLADSFFEWPTEDRTHVTLTSALLFAHHVLSMTKQAGDSTDQLRFKSACEISGEKHPEYVRGYEAAMDAVCKAQPAPIPTSERLPTQDDADCQCDVWAYHNKYGWDLYYWASVRQHPDMFIFWLPTGLKMPPAPGGEG